MAKRKKRLTTSMAKPLLGPNQEGLCDRRLVTRCYPTAPLVDVLFVDFTALHGPK